MHMTVNNHLDNRPGRDGTDHVATRIDTYSAPKTAPTASTEQGITDTPYVRAEVELTYVERMQEVVRVIGNGSMVLRSPLDYERWIPERLYQQYFASDLEGWVRDAAFERRIRTWGQSQCFFFSWGIQEFFVNGW